MGDAGELRRELGAGRCVGEIEWQPARAECLVGPAAGDGDRLSARLTREMLHGGVADEAGGAGDQDFLEGHAAIIARTETVYVLPGRPEEDPGETPLLSKASFACSSCAQPLSTIPIPRPNAAVPRTWRNRSWNGVAGAVLQGAEGPADRQRHPEAALPLRGLAATILLAAS